jgi:hypothetical protein
VSSSPASPRKRSARLVILALSALFVGLVVYGSLQIGGYECTLCITFRGQSVCRTVQGAEEIETRTAARTNVCALLAAGVTDTLACERTPPDRMECHAINDAPAK